MKKLLTICLIMTTVFTVNAEDIVKLAKIKNLLLQGQKVYNSSGEYSRVFDCKIKSEYVLEIWQLGHPLKSSSSETISNGASNVKILIDFSNVKNIYSSVTNFGYPCIAIQGKNGFEYTYYDQYERSGKTTNNISVSISVENEELLGLLKDYAELCAEDQRLNPKKFKAIEEFKAKKEIEKIKYQEKRRKEDNRDTLFTIIGAALLLAIASLL
jgi:hypothetical protein